MTEQEPKLPFSETQRIYREGVEALLQPHLDDPQSELVQKLEAGEAAYLDAGNDGGIKNQKRQIPIAMPVDYRFQKGNPENAHNFAQVFLYGHEILKDVSGYFGVSRESIRLSTKSALKDALRDQNEVEIEDITFFKPKSDEVHDRLSTSHGGHTVRIREAVEKGATYEDLREQGFTVFQIAGARNTLKRRQSIVSVPKARDLKDWSDTLEILSDPEIERIVKAELIQEVTYYIYTRSSRSEKNPNGIFVPVTDVAKMARLNPSARARDIEFISNFLRCKGIPVGQANSEVKSGKQKGEHMYNFILASDIEDAVSEIENSDDPRFDQMARPRVYTVGPKIGHQPNSSDLKNRKEYPGAFSLLTKFGIRSIMQLTAKNINFSSLFQNNPPVRVHMYDAQWHVHKDDREKLQEYLGEELKRWGVI